MSAARPVLAGLVLALLAASPAFAPAIERAPGPHIEVRPPEGKRDDREAGGKGGPMPGRDIDRLPPALDTPDFHASRDLKIELEKSPADIERALAIAARLDPHQTDFHVELSQIIATSSSTRIDVPSQSYPGVTFRRPEDPRLDGIVAQVAARIETELEGPVDRDKVKLLAFPTSADAAAKMHEEIPLYKRAQGPWIDDVVSGNFDRLDPRMFASLRGEIIIASGHVTRIDGVPAYEIRRADGGVRHIPVETLLRLSREVGFKFIPLGCATTDAIALGTAARINDLDALDAAKKAMMVSGTTRLGDLIADLSSADVQLTIDLGKVADGSTVPLDLRDRDRRLLGDDHPSAFGQINPSGGQGASAYSQQVPPSALAGTLWLTRWAVTIEQAWANVFLALVALAFALALIELPRLHAVPVRRRVAAAATFVILGAALAALVYYCEVNWLTSPGPFGVVAALGAWSVPLGLSEQHPDHRLALRASIVVVGWAQLPVVANLAIAALTALGVLATRVPGV